MTLASHRVRRALALALILAAALVAVAASGQPSAHADDNTALFIRHMDASDPTNVKVGFVYSGDAKDVDGLKLNQNGQDMTPLAPAAATKGDRGVVIVIDSGPGMTNSLTDAREGAEKFVSANAGGTMHFAVVQAGDKATLLQDFTTEAAAVNHAIEGIGPTQGSAIGGALSIAGTDLANNPQLQANVLLVVGDNDNVKPSAEPIGRSAVVSAGAAVWAVERSGGFDPTSINSLVSIAGGQILVADNDKAVSDLTSQAGTTIATQQYTVAYNANVEHGATIDLNLTVGDKTANANILANGVYEGAALHPNVSTSSSGGILPAFDNPAIFAVALLLTLISAAGIAYAITSQFVKDDLSSVLQPYADGYGPGGELETDDDALVKSAIVQRAVALTEQVAENQGLLTRTEGMLERANLPLRAGEALVIYLAIVIVATLLGLLWQRNIIVALVFGVLGAWIPIGVVSYIGANRRKKFTAQLPDMLALLSGTLRAGYSLMQGVEAVSQEVEEPMGLELRRVVTEARLGRPLEESLEASADRMDSADFAWAVMAIGIQREVGGNLSELLMTVADTMVHRERLRRDIRSLTAEGRVSAYILAGLPPMLGLIMWVLNPEYTTVLFTDPLGIGMLIAALIAMVVGFLWMRKIITIEI
jgi:tight adherence protein B